MPQKNQQGLAALTILAIVIVVGILAIIILPRTSTFTTNRTISGVFDVNGVVPSGAQISVMQKMSGSTDDYVTVATYPAQDHTTWSVANLQPKQIYEIKGEMVANGQTVAESSVIQASAPATNEVLTFNVTSAATGNTSTITGSVQVNGYIPAGSTITIQGKKVEAKTYTTVVDDLAAQESQTMTYSTAEEGQSYNVKGTLWNSSGAQIGESSVITVTAPAANEQLVINSTAQAPANQPSTGTSGISGTIDLNGDVPSGSTIVVYQALAGTTNYQVAQDSIQPSDGATWTWNGAVAGKSYQIFATVKVPEGSNQTDQDLGTSNTITVTAPAKNQTLSIDTGYQLKGAVGNITITCNLHNTDNTWNGTLNFQTIPGAQAYWFQLGSNNGGNDIVNQTQAAQNSTNQTINTTIKDSVVYYARYAYKNTGDLSQSNFSPFSAVFNVKCPN